MKITDTLKDFKNQVENQLEELDEKANELYERLGVAIDTLESIDDDDSREGVYETIETAVKIIKSVQFDIC